MLDEPVTEPVRRLIAKYESRIERLEKANGRLCEQINSMPEIVLCKDCSSYMDYEHEYEPNLGYCRFHDIEEVRDSRFCAWAKRKEVD